LIIGNVCFLKLIFKGGFMRPLTRDELPFPIRNPRPTLWDIIIVLFICAVIYALILVGAEMYRHEINGPLPEPISEVQKAHVEAIKNRWGGLKGHSWAVEAPNGTVVEVFDGGKWRRL
jgi:hypothetical protein